MFAVTVATVALTVAEKLPRQRVKVFIHKVTAMATDNSIFIDKVKIVIKSGDGGDGMNSFKAYKGKPAGRPPATAARAATCIFWRTPP